jgi:hypothetical protein
MIRYTFLQKTLKIQVLDYIHFKNSNSKIQFPGQQPLEIPTIFTCKLMLKSRLNEKRKIHLQHGKS